MLETDAREHLSQLWRRCLAETWPIEVRLFHEQDTIARTRREKSEDAAGRSGAGDRDVVRAHRVQASAGKMVMSNLHAFDVAWRPDACSCADRWDDRRQSRVREVYVNQVCRQVDASRERWTCWN